EALAERLGLEDAVIFVDRDGLDPTVAAEETALMDVYADLADVSRCGAECALAMAAGLPIVATKTGPTANCASAANRIFIRPLEDESGIAAAAELLASDPQLCAEIGTANREKAEIDFDANAMMEASAALFGEALGVHGRLMLPKPEAAPPRRPQARELEKRTPERRAPTPRAPAAAA
ncbi:MAG: glycosyltransferase, partial [Pseudomonadota bacterium]